MSASSDHVALPRRDDLALEEDRNPRLARELGEGRGDVDGAYHIIIVNNTLFETNLLPWRTLIALLVSHNIGRLPFREIYHKPTNPSICRWQGSIGAAETYRVDRVRRVPAFAMT